jgi:methionyl-tRNA formyltransferase
MEGGQPEPGVVQDVAPDRLFVGTANGQVSVLEVQLEGRKKMTIAEFLRGYSLKAGDRFGD